MTITADQIVELLKNRHPLESFLCVPECKCGPSWTADRTPRLDMWIMKKSYSQPNFIGYEIKVSRNDFLRDEKWVEYLPYCTEFYFVSPPDVISSTEVPGEAGLIVTSKNAKKLYTKKKAPFRNIEIPQSILLYILMSRATIVRDFYKKRPSHVIWQERLERIKKNKNLGYTLSHIIAEKVKKEVQEIKEKNKELAEENKQLSHIKAWLDEKGLSVEDATTWHGVSNKFKQVMLGLPFDFKEDLESLSKKSTHVLKAFSYLLEGE